MPKKLQSVWFWSGSRLEFEDCIQDSFAWEGDEVIRSQYVNCLGSFPANELCSDPSAQHLCPLPLVPLTLCDVVLHRSFYRDGKYSSVSQSSMQNDLGPQMVELRLGAWPGLIQFFLSARQKGSTALEIRRSSQ